MILHTNNANYRYKSYVSYVQSHNVLTKKRGNLSEFFYYYEYGLKSPINKFENLNNLSK